MQKVNAIISYSCLLQKTAEKGLTKTALAK